PSLPELPHPHPLLLRQAQLGSSYPPLSHLLLSICPLRNRKNLYFPQFEQSVRAEASGMAIHYETFYCLEKSIRTLIVEILKDAEPAGWWSSGRIPQDIVSAAESLIQKEIDGGFTRRSDDPIDYTTF